MSDFEDIYDSNALLENVDGCITTVLKDELEHSGGWEKLAGLCTNQQGKKIFSQADINLLSRKKYPAAALVDELVKRSITVKYLSTLLEKADMNEVLKYLKKEVKAEILSQSVSGLVDVCLEEKIDLEVKASGFPPPTYVWYKEDVPLLQHTSNTLTIDQFSIKDEGIYLCLVRQRLRDEEIHLWSDPIQLCVQKMPPTFITHPENVELFEGGKIELRCSTKAYPPPSYAWFKDGERLLGGVQEPTFVIETAQLSDSGSYECVAVNCEGLARSLPASVEVSPKGMSSHTPEIIHHPILCEDKPERSIGQTFSLLCSARCCQNLTFTWMVNGRPLEGNSSNRHIITTSATQLEFSSSLFYTVTEDDGSSIKVVCLVASPDSTPCCSKEIKIKVVSKDGPIQYTAGSKWALLIAMNSYNVGPLSTPTNDMERIAQELSQLDFHCLMLSNLNLTELKNCVKLFSKFIKPGDYVVFCYAGHGLFRGVDHLLPVSDNTSTTELETLPSVWVRSQLQLNHPALLFIVLDMCRHIHVAEDDRPLYVMKTQAERNYLILNATSEGYQSLENPKTSSILTTSLVKHLRDKVDVMTMARAVLRDVDHMSPFIRRAQIPSLDMNLWDARSLSDPVVQIDEGKEKVWASVVGLPQTRMQKMTIDGREVCVRVRCSPGGCFQLIMNVMHINVEVLCNGPPPPMAVAFNAQLDVSKEIVEKSQTVIYEVKAIHKIMEPLVMTIGFQEKGSNNVIQEQFHLGLPGIARVRLYNESFDPSLRAKNTSYNIP